MELQIDEVGLGGRGRMSEVRKEMLECWDAGMLKCMIRGQGSGVRGKERDAGMLECWDAGIEELRD